jgi:hypothetical protein
MHTPSGRGVLDKLVYRPWTQVGNASYVAGADTPMPGDPLYGREEAIRNSIGGVWKDLGVMATDLVIVSDVDEFISREFLVALRVCDAFPMHRSPLQAQNSTELVTRQRDRCRKTKVMSRSSVFSSYLDCPQEAKYLNFTTVYKGIRMYWHPDVIPGSCLLDGHSTVEQLRTRGGSGRLMKQVTGWHMRNLMTPEQVLYKYKTYSHASESPAGMRYNATKNNITLHHIMLERNEDCSKRMYLLEETNFSWANTPHIFRDKSFIRQHKDFFYNLSEYIDILNKNSQSG